MSDESDRFRNLSPLAGARIWLSGAVPEADGITETQRNGILDFVRRFSRRVFQRGGHIIHGSHPSFTPTLLDEVKHLASGNAYHGLALKDDGTVVAWGNGDVTNVPPGISNVADLAGGVFHSSVLIRRATAWRCAIESFLMVRVDSSIFGRNCS